MKYPFQYFYFNPFVIFKILLFSVTRFQNQNWFTYQHTIKVSSQAFVYIEYYPQYVGNIVSEFSHSLPNKINNNLYCNPGADLEVTAQLYGGECTLLYRESTLLYRESTLLYREST